MRPLSAGVRLIGQDRGVSAIDQYQCLWQTGEPSLEQFWARIGPMNSLTLLGTLVKIDLEHRFDRGERPSVAEYLARLPVLAGSGDRVVSLIYEEFCLLEENGEDPDSAQFCERYAPWRDSLKSQLVYHRELSRVVGAEVPPTRYPRPGDRFARYHLRSILGIGGAARVYLATEDELGGRKVALKISASIGREPSILANLDHRNIVPILTVTDSEDGLRGFCMPYRPGVTLEKLIQRLGSTTAPRSAREVWVALQPSDAGEVEGLEEDRPGWSDFPRSGTYPEAIAWIGLYLANALAYLHVRGVLHRDIKPANVLLAYRDGPQLLDFNLAHAPSDPEHAKAALKGGTLPFMAPEQLQAFLDPAGWEKVGAPADLYALGLVLRGLLTGQAPEVPNPRLPLTRAIRALHDRRSEPVVPVRQFNPSVPPALESIIAKCLEFEPSARHAGASELAEDLRRFLGREPLKSARNTSIIERGVNCLYRNKMIVAALSLVILASVTITPILSLLPAKTVIELAFSSSELRDYHRAVTELGSKDPTAWERARATFQRLSKAHPDLAWPMLYEAVTLEKLGTLPGATQLLGEANRKLTLAIQRPDYTAALSQRLEEDPRSVTLLVRQAYRIFLNSSDDESLAKAHDLLRTAVEIDSRRVDALAGLAEVEEKLHRPDEAIRHFSRAIEIAEATPKYYIQGLADCREKLLMLLTEKADAQIDKGASAAERQKAKEIFRCVEVTLAALDRSWSNKAPASTPEHVGSFQTIYRGSIESGLAALAGDDGDVESARDGFKEATRQFQAALQLALKYPQLNLRKAAEYRLNLVEERSRKYLGPG
jgi:serine/threonine protein kinase